MDAKDVKVVAELEDAGQDLDEISPQEGRSIIRGADLRLLPTLTLLYGLSFIDRSNLGFARIVGMSEDLNLTGNRFNVILMLFFTTYTLFEIPSNTIIRRVSVKKYLTALIVGWGTIAMCFGFTKTFGQMAGLRVLLGLFEAGYNVSRPSDRFLLGSNETAGVIIPHFFVV